MLEMIRVSILTPLRSFSFYTGGDRPGDVAAEDNTDGDGDGGGEANANGSGGDADGETGGAEFITWRHKKLSVSLLSSATI